MSISYVEGISGFLRPSLFLSFWYVILKSRYSYLKSTADMVVSYLANICLHLAARDIPACLLKVTLATILETIFGSIPRGFCLRPANQLRLSTPALPFWRKASRTLRTLKMVVLRSLAQPVRLGLAWRPVEAERGSEPVARIERIWSIQGIFLLCDFTI